MEQLLDYNLCITFVPPITIGKALWHISHRDVLHRNVHVMSVLIGRVEFNEPFVLSRYQTILVLEVNWKRLMLVMKRRMSGEILPLLIPVNYWSQLDTAWKWSWAGPVVSASRPTTQGPSFQICGLFPGIPFRKHQCQFCNSISKLVVL